MNEELKANPLKLGTFSVNQKQSDRYLSQILHSDGVQASIDATIADREGRVKGAIFEVQSIIEEFKMQAIGGMMAA